MKFARSLTPRRDRGPVPHRITPIEHPDLIRSLGGREAAQIESRDVVLPHT